MQLHCPSYVFSYPQLRPGRRKHIVAAVPVRQQQHDTHVQELSLVLLVNENIRRQLGRGLVEHKQLMTAHQVVDQSNYALLLVGSTPQSSMATQQSMQTTQQLAWPVLYANQAAMDAINAQRQQQHSSSTARIHDVKQLQQVQLPAAISSVLQQQQQQQGATPHSTCSLLQDVAWQPCTNMPDMQLTVNQMLLCPVNAPDDAFLGLALLFDAWSHADGCIGVPGWSHVHPAELPSQQQLEAAADAVRGQAEAVRQLKQGRGLSNKDPAVVEAVAALQQLKQQLARLEGLTAAFQPERRGELQHLYTEAQQQQQLPGVSV